MKEPSVSFKRGRYDVTVKLDTFGSKANYDRLIKNMVRVVSIFGIIYTMDKASALDSTSSLSIPMFVSLMLILFVFIALVGLTRIEWLQHDREMLVFERWR